MDISKVWMLFNIAEAAPKFPHMSGRVLEWVRLQLLDVDKEITQEIEDFKAKVQAEQDERHRQRQAKAAKQAEEDAKNTTKPIPQQPQNMPGQPVVELPEEPHGNAIEEPIEEPQAEPAPLPRRLS